jgi:tetratricopeptide (TPR) repeat protein
MHKIIILAIAAIFVVACGELQEQKKGVELREDIREQRQAIEEAEEARDKAAMTLELTNYLLSFADEHPEHEKSPEFLYEAGDLYARVLHQYRDAVKMFDRVYETYPDHEKAPLALFTSAYINEALLDNKPRAEMQYNQFLKDYPDHDFSEDVKFALQTIDKDPEDIIKEFRAREQE